MATVTLANSTYLDFTSYGTTTATTVAEAYHLSLPETAAWSTINVALVLPRVTDPTDLLTSDWATRQTTLQQLKDAGTLWSTFGASATDYANALATLSSMNIPVLGLSGADGYVSSQASRTIWVQLDPAKFQELFGTKPLQTANLEDGGLYYWNGSLSLPGTLNVKGLWLDVPPIYGTLPATSNLAHDASVVPQQGPQGIGNGLSPNGVQQQYLESNVYAGDIATWFYNFPLTGLNVPTATVGLLEPGIGAALPTGAETTFQQRLDAFRAGAGLSPHGTYYLVAQNGQSYFYGNAGERSLDVGVVSSANPNSTIGLYAGSGFGNHATSNGYTAYQSAFWDQTNNPPVLSSSFSIFQQSAPGSPFSFAVDELFTDAALRNITAVLADNDFGSSYNIANGLANILTNMSSPYALTVGGTSLTTLSAAPHDPSVFSAPSLADSVYGSAMAGDPATLWRLIQSGLKVLPSSIPETEAHKVALLESVWNIYHLYGTDFVPNLYSGLGAGDGGVDTARATPWYQSAFGLTPTSANPGQATGRGVPDVAANAGGNMFYITPQSDMLGTSWDDGTSAATPMWASLIAQIDTIFHDQGLPNLGFMTDLLYIAAAVAPASFNDITYGNNTTSFRPGGGPLHTGEGGLVTLTGYGYSAEPGYDLVTGLGTPNGTLLARALSTIAHAQMYFPAVPDVILPVSANVGDPDAPRITVSGANQTLLFQAILASDTDWSVAVGNGTAHVEGTMAGVYAWSNQFAQQTLQPDFSPDLVTMFDRESHSGVYQAQVAANAYVDVAIGGQLTSQPQVSLTSPYGFVDYVSADAHSAVQVARAVAIAETAGGANDQDVVVRMRQNGTSDLSVQFYKVDDLSGAIAGLAPGQSGYAEAVAGRAYHSSTGDTWLHGAGYGQYSQGTLVGVDAGDIIAMKLTDGSHTYYAFAQANETVDGTSVGHLWNYGLDTWGWEDLYGGGDRDYNDLVVQLDFTSASGHGWLV